MNSELTLNLQDLEQILTKSHCSCHFINPNKTRIILWKERSYNSELSQKEVKNEVVTYYLRIGIQKFVSYPLTDKNNETYWRFKSWEKEGVHSELSQKETTELSPKEAATILDPDPITKFQTRQAKTASLNHESKATNHSE